MNSEWINSCLLFCELTSANSTWPDHGIFYDRSNSGSQVSNGDSLRILDLRNLERIICGRLPLFSPTSLVFTCPIWAFPRHGKVSSSSLPLHNKFHHCFHQQFPKTSPTAGRNGFQYQQTRNKATNELPLPPARSAPRHLPQELQFGYAIKSSQATSTDPELV